MTAPAVNRWWVHEGDRERLLDTMASLELIYSSSLSTSISSSAVSMIGAQASPES
jgi:hypothetical protein